MLDFDLRAFYYVCGACVNACPQTAIRLVQAEDGSYIPKIDEENAFNAENVTGFAFI